MNQLLIIGYGNPLRGDDGIGWIVAEQIAARLPHSRVVATHQLTPEIAEAISQADFVLFVDAYARGEPGTLRCELIQPDSGTPIISHHIAPATLLTVARRLYHHCPPAMLCSITGLSFDFNDTLSPLVHHMLPSLVDEACRLIEPHIAFSESSQELEPCMNML